jgi:hypothetical protein
MRKAKRKLDVGRPVQIWQYQVVCPDGGRGAIFLHRKEALQFIETSRLEAMQRADHYSRCSVEKLKQVVDSAAYRNVKPEYATDRRSVLS